MRARKGFTTVELLVTLFIAALFLTAGYQLYIFVMRNDGNIRAQSLASNTASQYLSQYVAQAASVACSPSTPLSASPISVTGLTNTTVTVTESCPTVGQAVTSCQPASASAVAVAKIDVLIQYNQPQRQIEYSTYAKSLAGSTAPLTPASSVVSTVYDDDTNNIFTDWPTSMIRDSSGNFYVTAKDNHIIVKVTPSGTASIYAGTGTPGHTNSTLTSSTFDTPFGIACDSSGNIYVSESSGGGYDDIRKLTSSGVTTYIPTTTFPDNASLGGIKLDSNGNIFAIYAGDIDKITPSGVASTFYGTPTLVTDGLAFDSSGTLYATTDDTNQVLKFSSSGTATVVAGNGTAGFANGAAASAEFEGFGGLVIDQYGNIFVTDWGNNMIRVITPSGQVSTLAGNGTAGEVNGNGTTAELNNPTDLALDGNGNLYVLDDGGDSSSHSTIRKIAITYH